MEATYMFFMSALRFIMVLLIALPIAYILFLLAGDLSENIGRGPENHTKKRTKRKKLDGKKRAVHNSRRT